MLLEKDEGDGTCKLRWKDGVTIKMPLSAIAVSLAEEVISVAFTEPGTVGLDLTELEGCVVEIVSPFPPPLLPTHPTHTFNTSSLLVPLCKPWPQGFATVSNHSTVCCIVCLLCVRAQVRGGGSGQA
eukprot:COSAG01_NODE_20533_length_949_cov_0.824706_1_plen_126_part_10